MTDIVDPRLFNLEIEQSVLGAILINNDVYRKVATTLKPEHFKEELHGKIYELCGNRIEAGEIADPRTIRSFLRMNETGNLTAGDYLAMLAGAAGTASECSSYARMIANLSSRRRLTEIASDATAAAVEAPPDEPIGRLLETIEGEFESLRETHRISGSSLSVGHDAQAALEAAAAAYKRSSPAGWPWFIKDIEMTLDMRIEPGCLYGWLGASGDGKTSSVLQQLRFGAEAGTPGLFLSGEQSKLQCIWQMHVQNLSRLAERGRVVWNGTAKDIKDGKLSEAEFNLMVEDAQSLAKLPLAIQPWQDLTAGQIGVRVRAFVKRHGPCVCAIDHAKAIVPNNPKDIFAQQVFQVFRGLKEIAAETGSAIIIIMHRGSDFLDRKVMRPVRADVYGKESALNSLDACLAIYRAERWLQERINLTDGEAERQRLRTLIDGDMIKGKSGEHGKADLFALKTRFGEEGHSRKVRFVARFTRFASMRPVEVERAPTLDLEDEAA